jgi:hypothetical protein
VSQQYEKQETAFRISPLWIATGAITTAIAGMVAVSLGVIVLTGVLFGNQSVEFKAVTPKKNASVVIISYSQPLEDQISKSHLNTPDLPRHARSPVSTSWFNFKWAYRY